MKKRSFTKLLSFVLAFVLTATSVLSGLPMEQVQAATPKTWYHVEGGSGNGNGHSYSQAGSSSAALLLHTTERTTFGQTYSLTFEKQGNPASARLGFFYTYLDDNNWLYVGMNPDGSWYYEYKIGGTQSWPSLNNLPAVSDGARTTVSVSLDRETLVVSVNGIRTQATNDSFFTLEETVGDNGRFGFRAANNTSFRFTDAKLANRDISGEWEFLVDNTGQVFEETTIPQYTVTGVVVDDETSQPIADATVRIGAESAKTASDGTFSLDVESGTYDVTASASGYLANAISGVEISGNKELDEPIRLSKRVAKVYDHYIQNENLKAAVSDEFPQVYQYRLQTGGEEKIISGQEAKLTSVKINNTVIVPTVESVEIKNDHAVYTMTLKSETASIDMAMTVKISVSENDLIWEVTDISKNSGCAKINKIEVPNLNLVTIISEQSNAEFMGAVVSGDVTNSGDERITFDNGFTAGNSKDYAYGFLSADGVSVGVWSNSEMAADKRLVRNNGMDSMSLTSAAWYYEYGDLAASANYEGTPLSELPKAKVCLASDENKDGQVNWQDGAIAYRDIMNNPYGSENTKDLVNYRIVMNFSSQATNPFLKTADNIKKVYLATDGLPQAVMMKGFGSEGHDSANSEYGNIGERIGGLEELKQLNVIAHQYNTQTGIHINAQECYPEAQSFTDELVNGPEYKGWGWLDQSYTINRPYDLGTGLRYKRLLQLYDQLNNTSLYANKWPGVVGTGANETVASDAVIADTVAKNKNNPENLDFMYLDVWYGDSWETRKIAQQFNSLGWRFSTEFGYEGEYDSTWQHWATEGHYGGGGMKGLNSDVIRFIRNHQKDSFVLNWPKYGGAADNPLLGGFDLAGFEGWGSNNNFDKYLTTTFAINLPTKFLQHYKVYKWENYEEGESPVGNHEKQITLKSDDGKDTVVVTRNEKQRPDVGDSNELTHYNFVERTITLNGKKILDDVNYLLPWTDWETNEEKLYHYNYDGGTSTWELPNGWANLANVKVYTITDAGRINGHTVAVTGGKITLTAEPDTPYVVIKGTADTTPKSVTEWSNHAHVIDTGFNSYAGTGEGDALNSAVWTGDITDAKVVRVKSGNKYLQMGSETKKQKVSTTIEGLEPGKNYIAQVYVDNKSDAKAWIKVLGGTKNVSNYTLKSLAQNFVRCDAHNINAVSDSRMQTMLVSFTAKTSTAVLTLEREAGKGSTYFDDIRIVEKTLSNIKSNGDFEQDFETVVGGIYPFVIGPAQGVDDQVTHLSEKHAPYTQSGWGKEVLDDVIDGQWSLKHHGDNRGIIYRTIPQNLHLEPGTIYDISFDYQCGWGNNYYMVIGDGDTVVESLPNLEQTRAEQEGGHSRTEKCTFTITASGSGQSWFGLAARGTGLASDDWRKSYGYVDFVLDNLKVKKRGASISPSGVTVSTAKDPIELTVNFDNEADNLNPVKWQSLDENVAYVVPDAEDSKKCKVYFVGFGETEITAETTINFEEITLTSRLSFPETCDLPENEQKAAVWSGVYANTESDPKEDAIDGALNTYWQTQWSGSNRFTPSESNPAKLTVKASENILGMNRLHFATRSGNPDGIVEKYQVVIGNDFDESTHTISSPTYTSGVITPKDYEAGITSLSETFVFPNNIEGQYIQIQFMKGTGGAVTIAEVELDKIGSNNTAEEQGYIGANNNSQADKAKAALAAALEKAKVVHDAGQSTNSDESWQAFTEAYEAAVAGKDSTDADVLVELQQNLTNAQNGLVPNTQAAQDKLSEELAKAQVITEKGNYTDESWEKFQEALEAAENAGSITDPAKVVRLQQALANAMKNLVSNAKEAQMRLQEIVNAAKEIIDNEQGDYTNASWGAFETAYNDARSKLASENLEELENAASELEIKQNNLETNLQEARKKLSAKLKEVKPEVNRGQEDRTDTTWNAFLDVYENAEKALRSEDATVDSLNEWHRVLSNAKESLESALGEVSRKLSEALSSAAAIKNKGQQSYTNASWTAFINAYNDAEAGKNSKDVAQLTTLLTKLKDAQNALAEEKFAKGNTVIVNDVLYQVTDAVKKTVTAVNGTNSGSTSIAIQSTVVVNGVTCTVTEVSASAFKGFAKLKKVTIGSNVTKVGKEAFSGCKSLKNIKIQSKALKSFGKKALKGTSAKLKVKVQKKMKPTKLRSKLIKQIKKAGNKKVKVK